MWGNWIRELVQPPPGAVGVHRLPCARGFNRLELGAGHARGGDAVGELRGGDAQQLDGVVPRCSGASCV